MDQGPCPSHIVGNLSSITIEILGFHRFLLLRVQIRPAITLRLTSSGNLCCKQLCEWHCYLCPLTFEDHPKSQQHCTENSSWRRHSVEF